jgi:hypothetical protein
MVLKVHHERFLAAANQFQPSRIVIAAHFMARIVLTAVGSPTARAAPGSCGTRLAAEMVFGSELTGKSNLNPDQALAAIGISERSYGVSGPQLRINFCNRSIG